MRSQVENPVGLMPGLRKAIELRPILTSKSASKGQTGSQLERAWLFGLTRSTLKEVGGYVLVIILFYAVPRVPFGRP